MTSIPSNRFTTMLLVAITGGPILAAAPQKTFPTPEAAVQALIAAAKSNNMDEMTAVLGDDMKDQFRMGEASQSDLDRLEFVQAAESVSTLQNDDSPDKLILYVGEQAWPFPAPLVKDGSAWRFDGKEGKQEILDRRVGRNEMHAVETCLGYVDAQLDYIREDHHGDGMLQFAQRIVSSAGKQDGLYWDSGDQGPASPLGPSFVRMSGDSSSKPTIRHHGYHFRILTAQGGNAPGGARNYLMDGRLLGGFGLIAWPTEYGVTGIQTFIVNQSGVIYEKDLGAQTVTAVTSIQSFDPDSSWKKMR